MSKRLPVFALSVDARMALDRACGLVDDQATALRSRFNAAPAWWRESPEATEVEAWLERLDNLAHELEHLDRGVEYDRDARPA